MAATPTSTLLSILDHYQPDRLLSVSQGTVPAVDIFCREHPQTRVLRTAEVPLSSDLANQRYDMAIVADQLEHLDKRSAIELLAGLRNLSASRLAVLVNLQQASSWQENDFFALALQRHATFEQTDHSLTLFTYDLAEYKSVPDWLNAKYWANPEMFDKYWW